MFRTGFGLDVHAFAENRDCILGGVKIPYKRGLAGHSDADVLVHSIMDALLGAIAAGDIGKHFPDTDNSYKNISSIILLENVKKIISKSGYKISNIDSMVVAEKPKIAKYIDSMRENIANALSIDISQISVKATTSEKLGFTGREEGIASYATVILISEKLKIQL